MIEERGVLGGEGGALSHISPPKNQKPSQKECDKPHQQPFFSLPLTPSKMKMKTRKLKKSFSLFSLPLLSLLFSSQFSHYQIHRLLQIVGPYTHIFLLPSPPFPLFFHFHLLPPSPNIHTHNNKYIRYGSNSGGEMGKGGVEREREAPLHHFRER